MNIFTVLNRFPIHYVEMFHHIVLGFDLDLVRKENCHEKSRLFSPHILHIGLHKINLSPGIRFSSYSVASVMHAKF